MNREYINLGRIQSAGWSVLECGMNEIRVALLDFDGTLVSKDILDVLTSLVGKEKESQELNEAFHRGELPGFTGLIKRINFLSGLTQSQIAAAIKQNAYLMPGARELMLYFQEQEIMTILASGNILPVLNVYQEMLGIDYVVGTKPKMDGETIVGITESAFSSSNFKMDGIKSILGRYDVKKENIMAMGDSPSDKGMFEMSGFSMAVNPKGDIADFADVVVKDDLREAIQVLEKL